MELEGKVINCLGDSITEGIGASCVQNGWPHVMERLYRTRVNNYGVGGSRIARQIVITDEPYDEDFLMRLDRMDESADAIVVFGGTNDFGHGEAPLGVPTDRTPATYWGACHLLMRELLTRYCGKPILIVTPLHRSDENDPRGDGTGRKKYSVAVLKTYVDILKTVAAEYSLPVLDLYNGGGFLPSVPIVRERLMPDGLHPSDEGHAILARRIGEALKAL